MKGKREWNLDHAYLAVMCVSLICCLTLLGSVVLDRPLTARTEDHVPVLRLEQEGEHGSLPAAETEQPGEELRETALPQSGVLLTGARLQTLLEEALPEDFPAERIGVELEDGLLELEMAVRRQTLIAYLKQRGARFSLAQSLALKLLPSQLQAKATFAVAADEAGLHFTPLSLQAGEKSIALSGLPQDVFGAVDQAANSALAGRDIRFSSAQWTEEGLLLQ